MTFLEIAERCENASEPDSMIDYAIARLRDANGKIFPQLHYTMSLEAALTLVPEGLGFALCAYARSVDPGGCTAAVDGNGARGATPALALCAAALRARSVLPQK